MSPRTAPQARALKLLRAYYNSLVLGLGKAVTAGAALLADGRPFTLKKSDGKEMAVAKGTINAVTGVKDDAIVIDQDYGGGNKATTRLKLSDLGPQTRYELAVQGLPPGPESSLKLAFVELLMLQNGAEGAKAEAVRSRLEAARKAEAPAERVEHLAGRLEAVGKEQAAKAAYQEIEAALKARNWEQARALVEIFRKDYARTITLAQRDQEQVLDRRIAEINPTPVFLCDLPELEVRGHSGLGKGKVNHENKSIQVNGVASPHGLAMVLESARDSSSSHVLYVMGKAYRSFEAAAAIDDSSRGPRGQLTFKVLGDSSVLWQSASVQAGKPSPAFRVDVGGVEKLELLVECSGDSFGAHAVWIEPRLMITGATAAAAKTPPAPPCQGGHGGVAQPTSAVPPSLPATPQPAAGPPASVASAKSMTFVAKASEASTKSGFVVAKSARNNNLNILCVP